MQTDDFSDMGYYMYALHKFKWTPDKWARMSNRAKAIVIADIDIVIEQEQEAARQQEI